eukprot:747318-Hanusia_phi.AAC.2
MEGGGGKEGGTGPIPLHIMERMREKTGKSKSDTKDPCKSTSSSLKARYLQKLGVLKKDVISTSKQEKSEVLTISQKDKVDDINGKNRDQMPKSQKKKTDPPIVTEVSKQKRSPNLKLNKQEKKSSNKSLQQQSTGNATGQTPPKNTLDDLKGNKKTRFDSPSPKKALDSRKEKKHKDSGGDSREDNNERPRKKSKLAIKENPGANMTVTLMDEQEDQTGQFPYEIDDADHAETPAEAYADISHILTHVAGTPALFSSGRLSSVH